eukprot:11118580-Ditylum_brightwellii.AAC.1
MQYNANTKSNYDILQYTDKRHKGKLIWLPGFSVSAGFDCRKKANEEMKPFDEVIACLMQHVREDG